MKVIKIASPVSFFAILQFLALIQITFGLFLPGYWRGCQSDLEHNIARYDVAIAQHFRASTDSNLRMTSRFVTVMGVAILLIATGGFFVSSRARGKKTIPNGAAG